jgi:hypothetical protein
LGVVEVDHRHHIDGSENEKTEESANEWLPDNLPGQNKGSRKRKGKKK